MIDLGRCIDFIVCIYLAYKAIRLVKLLGKYSQKDWM